MNVLWLSNYALPKISASLGRKGIVNEGWKITISEQLARDNDLTIAFPSPEVSHIREGRVENINFVGFPCEKSLKKRIDNIKEETEIIKRILSAKRYDVIHIWGTEFPHSLAAVNAAQEMGLEKKVVVFIQGIAKECAVHYYTGVKHDYIKKQCLIDVLRGKSIFRDALLMEKRGEIEDQVIQLAHNCIGRTEFDKRYVLLLNPKMRYYTCNETLRECFYDGMWTQKNCVKHSIFMSQASYPLKGIHTVLKALKYVKERYPDVTLRVAGGDVFQYAKQKNILKSLVANHAYAEYLRELADEGELRNSIFSLDMLNAEEMKENYLKANVYLLASNVENSPNSLGEAMLLGVPSIASNVGGVSSVCQDSVEVLLYQHDDPYMLASRIIELFENNDLQERLSNNARKRARITHDPQANYDCLVGIYDDLDKGEKQ